MNETVSLLLLRLLLLFLLLILILLLHRWHYSLLNGLLPVNSVS
jgi:hypothetical protein